MKYLYTRFGLPLVAVGLLLVLSGCVSVSASAGVDAEFNAYITYRVELDTEGGDEEFLESATSAVQELAAYYTALGFDETHNTDGRIYWLEVTRRERRASLEEAFAQLEDMLQDEDISLFTNVDMGSAQAEYHTAYVASVGLDIQPLLDSVALQDVPYHAQLEYEAALEEVPTSLTLTIPGTEIVKASGGPEQLDGFVRVRTDGAAAGDTLSLYLSTIISSDEAEAIRQKLTEEEILEPEPDPDAQRTKLILWIFCGLCFVVSFICIIVLIVSIIKRKKE